MNKNLSSHILQIEEVKDFSEQIPSSAEEFDYQENIFAGIAQVNLPNFKGPLDVLCLLLRRGELDSKKVSPIEVSRQVHQIIPHLAGFDLLGAGTTIYYDALLLQIKSALLSKNLLPEISLVSENVEKPPTLKSDLLLGVDLLNRLFRKWYGMYPRGAASGDPFRPLAKVDPVTRKKLILFYLDLLKRPQTNVSTIQTDVVPITQRRNELLKKLPLHQKVSLQDLWKNEHILDKVLTFLTILDMSFQQIVILIQNESENDLWIKRVKTPITFESLDSSDTIEQLKLEITS